MRLAVLVDRGHHEYPISADYVGITTDVDEASLIKVNFIETDDKEQVTVE
jgi:pyrimidine operon attenuation protein/uracil phosphoribosyltransferase